MCDILNNERDWEIEYWSTTIITPDNYFNFLLEDKL